MTDTIRALSQYMTPDWAAEELVQRYFGDLDTADRVVEPSCGRGAFLRALPAYVPAVGIEIDPALARVAEAHSGRQVIVGDFRTTELPFQPTAMIGNPPFKLRTVEAFLDRAWGLLPPEGRCGLLLPVGIFQTANTVERIAQRWSVAQELLPRNLFHKLRYPICFAVLTKGTRRGLVGFALFHEKAAVDRLQRRYRALLAEGERSVWAAVTRAALEAIGGAGELCSIYREIEGHRPTSNTFWQAKVRQTLQRIAKRVGPGQWALLIDETMAA